MGPRKGTGVRVVITDLDNTLYDWMGMWYSAFTAMLDSIVTTSGIPRETLIPEIRWVHQRYGTSEYARLIQELPSLSQLDASEDLAQVYSEAIDLYRTRRDAALELYPGVGDTLRENNSRGIVAVGYTESRAFYTNYRVRKLGLDGLLDRIYSPADHGFPPGVCMEKIRRYPADHYELKKTRHMYLPPGAHKPDPNVLLGIVAQLGEHPEHVVYVGDSLYRDILMARGAGIADVHAAYGQVHDRQAYDLLRVVTHWTQEDVDRERVLMSGKEIKPSYVLHEFFGELLSLPGFLIPGHAIGLRDRSHLC